MSKSYTGHGLAWITILCWATQGPLETVMGTHSSKRSRKYGAVEKDQRIWLAPTSVARTACIDLFDSVSSNRC
ncbi:uncharacterized protein BO95DRAFT_92429 [Aspergillus brunneoviolaceus CBS 621.78]|uniref:Uncharacterized protein n=1 Tax=Aspergillus brunneoviolaceus CBS 621.78 TaxID=1450534 RepID=A0ACD1GCP8_9EURO|nr:hypothetical protein BO95DRAFT_92429 [Aspergillus brunneoviolaceus CBS 621.78]RAH46938.1 hypothetical protein BO95DRAFT_92429 [Aspergillus brunneoviolaceus CBS 621.78]